MTVDTKPEAGDRKSVLFISHLSGLFGAERSLLDLVLGLQDRFKPAVMTPSYGSMNRILEKESIPNIVIPFSSWLGERHKLLQRGVRKLINHMCVQRMIRHPLVKESQLIYTNTLFSPVGAIAARRLGKPHIWHIRELVEEGLGVRFDEGQDEALTFVEQSSAAVIFNSQTVLDTYGPSRFGAKATLLYNGFSESLFEAGSARSWPPGETGNPLTLLMIGALTPNKGHEDAVRALRILKERGQPARLQLAGQGPETYRRSIQSLADNEGVADQVTWLGFVDDPVPLLLEADISLVCSRCESFGRAAVEALATGCPVIGTSAYGIREILRDGETGLLYPPGDEEALAACILRLAGDPGLCRALSSAGREDAAQRFALSRYIEEAGNIIQQSITS